MIYLKCLIQLKNRYLQVRDKEDCPDTWFQDIDNWVFQFKHKIYNWLREAQRLRNVCKKEQPIR